MIDPDQLPVERFHEKPVLTDEELRAERQRNEDNLRWLESHHDFSPLGYEW